MAEQSPLKCALNECNRSWHVYLNTLNDLCGAGSQLAHALSVMEMCVQQPSTPNGSVLQNPTMLLKNSWHNLSRATREATILMKANIESLLQEFIVFGNLEAARNHNSLIVLENAQTLLKVQQKFCATTRRAFSALTCCLACQSPVGQLHAAHCSMINQVNLLQQTSPEDFCERVWGGENSPFPKGVHLDPEPRLSLDTTKNLESLRQIFEQTNGLPPIRRQSMPAVYYNDNFFKTQPTTYTDINSKEKENYNFKSFYRDTISSFDFPPFPLNHQETYIEAHEEKLAESGGINTVTWNQTQMMPKISAYENFSSDNYLTLTDIPEDGFQNALKLLSISPSKEKPFQIYNKRKYRQARKIKQR